MLRFIQHIPIQKFIVDMVVRNVQKQSHNTLPTFADYSNFNVAPLKRFPETKSNTFENKNIVITGGAQGLGRVLATKLAQLKANVVIWDDNRKAIHDTTQIIKVTGGNICSFVCDLSQREEIYRAADKTKKAVGDVQVVINSAEVAAEQLLLNTPDHLIQKTFDINTLSMFWTTKAFLPSMVESNKGHIVTISSMAGHMGVQKLTDYCSSKAAVGGFITALRTELKREGTTGVNITMIFPYFTNHGPIESNLRLVKPLDVELVADVTIEAIRKKQPIVFVPGWFKFILIPRWITPPILSSWLLKVLIKDRSPELEKLPLKITEFVKLVAPIEANALKEKEVEDDIKKLKQLHKRNRKL